MGPNGIFNTGMGVGDRRIAVNNCTLKRKEVNKPHVRGSGDKSSVGTSTCRLNTEEWDGNVVCEAESGEFTPPKTRADACSPHS